VSVDYAMNFAEATSDLSLDTVPPGVVSVDRGLWHSCGICSCGWQGRPHLLPAIAIHDAHLHSARNRCRLAVPLVWPAG
jgi:hypothetical protein